ncbi:MAG: MmcQ/YjbR family DNA-binding protein [Ginsengibacter sp.]|jgi:predicted DNA-binding protein (MmcQ/YjbR family)
MNIEELREFALSLENVSESFPFGPDTLVFKTNEKIFLLLALDTDSLQFNVKCDPEKAIELREQYDSVLPGYHMNKKHWNTIIVDDNISSHLIKEWIYDSYGLVAKKKKH